MVGAVRKEIVTGDIHLSAHGIAAVGAPLRAVDIVGNRESRLRRVVVIVRFAKRIEPICPAEDDIVGGRTRNGIGFLKHPVNNMDNVAENVGLVVALLTAITSEQEDMAYEMVLESDPLELFSCLTGITLGLLNLLAQVTNITPEEYLKDLGILAFKTHE